MFIYRYHRLGEGAINRKNIMAQLSCNEEKEDQVPLVYS